ncbi:MAG: hypothetical protein RRB13_07370 [bacterium]|nr:hypothetical protein [bacterium]
MSQIFGPLAYFSLFCFLPGLWLARLGYRKGFWTKNRPTLALGLGLSWHLYSLLAFHALSLRFGLSPWIYFGSHFLFLWLLRDWLGPKGLSERLFRVLTYHRLSQLGLLGATLIVVALLANQAQLPRLWDRPMVDLESLGTLEALKLNFPPQNFFFALTGKGSVYHLAELMALYLSKFLGHRGDQAYFFELTLLNWAIIYLGFSALVDRWPGRRLLVWLLFWLLLAGFGSISERWHLALLDPSFGLALALLLMQLFSLLEVRRGNPSGLLLISLALGPLVVMTQPVLAVAAVLPGFFLSFFWWISKTSLPPLFFLSWFWPAMLGWLYFQAQGMGSFQLPVEVDRWSWNTAAAMDAVRQLPGLSRWVLETASPKSMVLPGILWPLFALLVSFKTWFLLLAAPFWTGQSRVHSEPGVWSLFLAAVVHLFLFQHLNLEPHGMGGYPFLFLFMLLLALVAAMQFQPAIPRRNQRPAYLFLVFLYLIASAQFIFSDRPGFGPKPSGLAVSSQEILALQAIKRSSPPGRRLLHDQLEAPQSYAFALLAQRPSVASAPSPWPRPAEDWLRRRARKILFEPMALPLRRAALEELKVGAILAYSPLAFDPTELGWLEQSFGEGLTIWLQPAPLN